MQRGFFCLNSLYFCVNSLSFCSLPCMLVHANIQCVYGYHNNFLLPILPWFLYHMTGNIQSRRCRVVADVGRRTNQNKCRTKKYPHFVLFSCRRISKPDTNHVRYSFHPKKNVIWDVCRSNFLNLTSFIENISNICIFK